MREVQCLWFCSRSEPSQIFIRGAVDVNKPKAIFSNVFQV